MGARPVIGICSMVERANWTVWSDVEVNVSQRTYSRGVAEAGGLPLILPPDERRPSDPAQLLDLLDGLVLAGGSDIDPAAYGAEPDPRHQGLLARARPLRAGARPGARSNVTCRCSASAAGCSCSTSPAAARSTSTSPTPSFTFTPRAPSPTTTSASSRARWPRGAVGAERVSVRSHHHQGVDRLGDGLVATGWADPGETVEAIEMPDQRWALGILWHTEEERRSPVLAALTAACTKEAVA